MFKQRKGDKTHPIEIEGKLLIRELGLFASENSTNITFVPPFLFLLKISLPFIARYLTYGTATGFDSWDSWVYSMCQLAVHFIYFVSSVFIFAGFNDFQRRMIMIKAVGAIINPFKDNFSIKYQMLPTLMMTCKETVNSWMQLRMCTMDFGKKYMVRIFVYCSTFFAVYLFFIIIILLSYFELITLQLSLIAQLHVLLDVSFVLSIILFMLYFGAVVN